MREHVRGVLGEGETSVFAVGSEFVGAAERGVPSQEAPATERTGSFERGPRSGVATIVKRGDWAEPIELDWDELSPAERERLARGWAERALVAHAALGNAARFTLELLGFGAPWDLVARAERAVTEWTRHVEFDFGVVQALRGVEGGPGPLPPSALFPRSLDDAVIEHFFHEVPELARFAEELDWVSERTEDDFVAPRLAQMAHECLGRLELSARFLTWALERDPALRARVFTLAGTRSAAGDRVSRVGTACDDEWFEAYGLVPEAVAEELAARSREERVQPIWDEIVDTSSSHLLGLLPLVDDEF